MGERDVGSNQYLGRHTTLAYLTDKRNIWQRIPYLRENEGRAPPIVLAVGDRRRVHAVSRRLRRPILLPEATAKLSNRRIRRSDLPSMAEFGRVAMAIGLVSSIPILVVETQMGAPATQIIMNEVLSDQITSTEYRVGRNRVSLRHKVVIRIGTAGGINCEGTLPIAVGDIVNATHSIGATGAIMQLLSRLDFWRPDASNSFCTRWTSLGSAFTISNSNHPRVECSSNVIEAIDRAGERLAKGAYHKGGNLTKDSLYAELTPEFFVELCRTENCRTTEMELSAIAVAAHQHDANFGMISAIIGVLPGASFAESEKTKAIAERRALQVGLDAITNLI